MAILHGGEQLEYDTEARRLEEAGLDASVRWGEHQRARELYDEALLHVPESDIADRRAQRGSILRNRAFTHTREGTAEPDPTKAGTLFALARSALRLALAETEPVAPGTNPYQFAGCFDGTAIERRRREFQSAHAATLTLIARNGTAEEVVTGRVAAETIEDRRSYLTAHGYARRGSNGYFRVNNAMSAAVDARREGLRPAVPWVGRALFGIVWTTVRDPGNFREAGGTIWNRRAGLLTRTRARQSIRARP